MSSPGFDCALTIIGAGVVGCAAARSLAEAGLGPIHVLESAEREGTGISSRNSQVVHAGLYYPPGSRKARTCVAGMAALWQWVQERGVAHQKTGKLVVTTGAGADTGLEALELLERTAEASGATLEPVTLAEARALEPHLPPTVTAARWSPRSGIVDAHGLVRSLIAAAEATGRAELSRSTTVTAIEALEPGFRLHTSRGPLTTERLINAAGMGATTLARQLGVERSLFLARGDYYRLRAHPPWRRLIYPISAPGDASLGIHLTLELDGRCRLGPDLDWLPAGAPEDYGPARGQAKHGAFARAARELLGPIDAADLSYDGCGIRPKLVGPGQTMADFEIVESPRGAWHLLGIESPGLTAAMALAAELAAALSPQPSRT